MKLTRARGWLSIVLLAFAGLCGSARAGVIVSAGEQYNHTFDFSSLVSLNGPGLIGFDIRGQCLTQVGLAQVWLVDVQNVAGGTFAQSGALCVYTGSRFSSDSYRADNNGILTVSFRVSSGVFLINYLSGSFALTVNDVPVTQVVIDSNVSTPKSVHLLLISFLMMAFAQHSRLRKYLKNQYRYRSTPTKLIPNI